MPFCKLHIPNFSITDLDPDPDPTYYGGNFFSITDLDPDSDPTYYGGNFGFLK